MGFPDSSVGKESAFDVGDPGSILGLEDPLEKGWATYSSILGLPCGSAGKESTCNAGDLGSIPGLGRSPGAGNGNPLQCSCLGNPMDRGAWQHTVHGVAKETQLSNWACSMHALHIKPALGTGEKDENEQGTDPALKNLTVERRQEMHLKDTAS